MKTTVMPRLVPFLLALAITACASPGKGPASEADHKAHHPEQNSPVKPSSAARPVAPQKGMAGSSDMKSMCEMHKNMMSAKSPAEREAMMEQKMKSMSPEMRRQHMEMMSEMCKSS